MDDPTAALLWASCRPDLAVEEISQAVAAGADLQTAADLAIAQRVSPLLWRALTAAGVTAGGDAWAERLERDATRCRAQSRIVMPRLAELALPPLAAAGLEPLVIKGGALVGRYADPSLRPMDDVDIVLPPPHVDRAIEVWCRVGWEVLPTTRRHRHEVTLTHRSVPGLHLDLHRTLGTWRTRSNRLTTSMLWAAREPGAMFGQPVCLLPTEWELVMLAAHAAKPWHAFDRLIWAADIAIVLRNATLEVPVDWDEVARIADMARARTALAVALTQAAVLGVASPEELRQVRPARRVHALRPLMSPSWATETHNRKLRAVVRYALVDERRTRLRLVASELLSSTVWDVPRRAAWMTKRTVEQFAQRRRARVS